jgi:hypothetical protein
MRNLRLLALISAVLVVPGAAFAQPSISGVSGEISQNATVTITGSGFGSKVPAAPLKYDNFQNGTPGETLDPGHPSWNLWASRTDPDDPDRYYPKYSDEQPRVPGDIAARQKFGNTPAGYQGNCTIGLTGLTIGKLYVTGWAWHDRSESGVTGARNVKIWQNCVGAWGAPTTRWDCYPINGDGSGHIYTDQCEGGVPPSNVWGAGMPTPRTWHRLEIWHDRGSSSRNEEMWVYTDGRLVKQFSNAYQGCQQDRVYIMSYHDQNEGNGAWMNWYWSELYVDVTQARVELGNASTFSSCTHKEIQIPTAWSSGSLSFSANVGTFSPGSNVYLYVVDSNGSVNSNGYPLVVGGTVEDEHPGQPGRPYLLN